MSWLLVIASNQIKREEKNLDCAELLRFSLSRYIYIFIYIQTFVIFKVLSLVLS